MCAPSGWWIGRQRIEKIHNVSACANEQEKLETLNDFLARFLEKRDWSLFAPQEESPNLRPNVEAEIVDLKERVAELIRAQTAPRLSSSVRVLYAEQIEQAQERLSILENHLATLNRETKPQTDHRQREMALNDLSQIGLEAFWDQPANRINQMLYNLFGRQRLFVRDGQICGVGPAPIRNYRPGPGS